MSPEVQIKKVLFLPCPYRDVTLVYLLNFKLSLQSYTAFFIRRKERTVTEITLLSIVQKAQPHLVIKGWSLGFEFNTKLLSDDFNKTVFNFGVRHTICIHLSVPSWGKGVKKSPFQQNYCKIIFFVLICFSNCAFWSRVFVYLFWFFFWIVRNFRTVIAF